MGEQGNIKKQIYANEADVLNVALFGITAKEWQEKNLNYIKLFYEIF